MRLPLSKPEFYVAVAVEFFAKAEIDSREGGFFVDMLARSPANPVTVDRERYGGLDSVIGERDQVEIGCPVERSIRRRRYRL